VGGVGPDLLLLAGQRESVGEVEEGQERTEGLDHQKEEEDEKKEEEKAEEDEGELK
jgi:hypothetical protein